MQINLHGMSKPIFWKKKKKKEKKKKNYFKRNRVVKNLPNGLTFL